MSSTKSDVRDGGQVLNPFEHALKRPDAYIGSAVTSEQEMYTFDLKTGRAILKTIKSNPGLISIIREIGSNAIDNVWRSQGTPLAMKYVHITIDTAEKTITFVNDGYCIPIAKQRYKFTDPRTQKEEVREQYPAEVYFGDMFSGTNYSDEETRKTSGRNGMGAKASNIFSSKFTIDHTNPEDGKRFVQTYTENGQKRTDPKVTVCRKKQGYTKIEMTPDLEYFKFEDAFENPDFLGSIALYAREMAMITKLNITFSIMGGDYETKDIIKIPSLMNFVNLFHTTKHIHHITSPTGDECVIVDSEIGDDDIPDISTDIPSVSFVNGIRTTNGGVHTRKWRDTIISSYVRAFNSRKVANGKTAHKTSGKDVYPYLTMFIRSEVDRPRFSSQTKDTLTEVFNSKGDSVPYSLLPEEANAAVKKGFNDDISAAVQKMMKFPFASRLVQKLEWKNTRTKTVAKNPTNKRLSHGGLIDDANFAGTSKSSMCKLLITEGLSAKAFAVRGISSQKGGHDIYGAFPIKGKFCNTGKKVGKLDTNKEIILLKQVLNLVDGVDYSKDENFETLRYGKVVILADADDDGIHIRGLLLNFFYTSFPSLIKRDYIESFSTAVVLNTFNRNKTFYYSNTDFKKAYGKGTIRGDVKYLKGLGSINPSDAGPYFSNPKLLTYRRGLRCDDAMEMCFGGDTAGRKEWIGLCFGKSIDDKDYKFEGDITLDEFVQNQMIIYAITANIRSIPSITDGFKECHRKIMHTVFEGNMKKTKDLERLAGAIKDKTGYHHGAASLFDAIKKLAQGFVGSNNIPLLEADGEFGTRKEMGSDGAAPRYVATKDMLISRSIFNKEDNILFDYNIEDNEEVEPSTFFPVIPLVLVNGSDGIGLGYSSKIPAYKPDDLVKWIETWLGGGDDKKGAVGEMDWLKPWYRNFTGDITLVHPKGNELEPPEAWTSRGALKKSTSKKGWWEITETPVGLSTSKLMKWIDFMYTGNVPTGSKGAKWKKREVNPIRDMTQHNGANDVHIKFLPSKDFIPDIDTPGNLDVLKNRSSLKNMILISTKGVLKKYDSAEDILLEWCDWRLDMYKTRIKLLIEKINLNISIVSNRLKFVKQIVDSKLNINVDEVDELLQSRNFEKFEVGAKKGYNYLLDMPMRSMTLAKITSLEDELAKMKSELDYLKRTTPEKEWTKDLEVFKTEYKKFLRTTDYN